MLGVIPDCPYCEKPLDGPIINGLHMACNEKLSAEMAEWEEKSELFRDAELARQ